MDRPLVSALMPTCNRRDFIPRAIRCFLSQDYSNLELIILDDGTDPIRDLLPADPRIKYFHESPKKIHGPKMNRCFELAQGEYGVVFDDDDWYSANRISRQVQPMIDNPLLQATGTSTLYYYRWGTQEAWCYSNPPGIAWLASIAVRRTAWEQNRWEELSAGSDWQFQRKLAPGTALDLKDPSLIVASVHATNACRKTLGREYTRMPWETIVQVTGGAL
jgi:glycosyltransferase involved in cell wall biosynthesis